jgi:hypothetical protein
VGVGDDVTVVVDHEARARRRPSLGLTERVERRGLGIPRGLDEGDAGRILAVDLVHRERLAALVGGRLGE